MRSLVTRPDRCRTCSAGQWKRDGIAARLWECPSVSDGKLLATGGIDGMIRLWDMATGELIRILAGHNSYIWNMPWSPDGKMLASAGTWDATIRVWVNSYRHAVTNLHPGQRLCPVSRLVAGWNQTDFGRPAGTAGSGCGTPRMTKPDWSIEVGQDVLALDWKPDGEEISVSVVQIRRVEREYRFRKARGEMLGDATAPVYSLAGGAGRSRLAVGSSTDTTISTKSGRRKS